MIIHEQRGAQTLRVTVHRLPREYAYVFSMRSPRFSKVPLVLGLTLICLYLCVPLRACLSRAAAARLSSSACSESAYTSGAHVTIYTIIFSLFRSRRARVRQFLPRPRDKVRRNWVRAGEKKVEEINTLIAHAVVHNLYISTRYGCRIRTIICGIY